MTQTPEQIARGLSVPQRQAIFPGPGNPEYACGAEAVGAGNSRGERNMSPEQHADAILRAAGSSLANYTMPGTRAAILAAVQAVRDDECARVVAWLRAEGREDCDCKSPIACRLCSLAAAIEHGDHLTKGEG